MADKNESLCRGVNALTLNPSDNGATVTEQVNRHNASPTQLESPNLTTDGPLCDAPFPVSSPPDILVSTTDSRSTTTLSCNDEMRDFVIVHTKNDCESALEFSDHLHEDAEDGTVTIDLLEELDIGKSKFTRAKTLHDRYRLLLIFVTDEFKHSKSLNHINEMLLESGFNDDSKYERVVPVFTKRDCTMEELNGIVGIEYFERNHGSDLSKRSYRNIVKNLIKTARKIKPS